jgi:hypothetical protein
MNLTFPAGLFTEVLSVEIKARLSMCLCFFCATSTCPGEHWTGLNKLDFLGVGKLGVFHERIRRFGLRSRSNPD